MGNMKVFLGLFGYEKWGALRPVKMWDRLGRCFVPIAFCVWVRKM